jgi:uncharacterized protein (TIGR01244 family)
MRQSSETTARPGDPAGIRAWQRIDAGTTTSGVLGADDLLRLKELGVATVINLALADSPGILPDEAERLAALGIGYIHIPVAFGAPGEAEFAAFRAAMDTAPAPVHVHCVMNWRVSAFFYRLHRDHRGMDEAMARALMAVNWEPETSDHADAPVWADFVARRG